MPYLSPEPKKRSPIKGVLLIIVPIVILAVLVFVIFRQQKNPEVEYYKSIMSAEAHEYASPSKFLKADGTYRPTIFGRKFRIEGSITNSASVATYKDAVLEVTFYSQTKTKIGSTQVTIYEVFPPMRAKTFNVKIDAPKATDGIGYSVVDAARN